MSEEIKSMDDLKTALTEVESAAASEPSADAAAPTQGDNVDASQAPAEPEWTPNYKFKVLDEEKEIDEWARPFINKDTESKFRELYEKSYGLDHIKPKLNEERQARQQVEDQYKSFAQRVSEIVSLRDQDLDLFFDKVNLSEDQVLKWAVQKAIERESLKDLPDPVKKVYNEYGTLKRDNDGLKRQLHEIAESFGASSVQAKSLELQQEISSPEVVAIATQVDARLGKEGAFRDLVIRHGKSEFDLTGRDLTAKQAVSEVLKILGMSQGAGTAPTPNDSATQQKAKVITSAKPTVLPNTGSGSGSATAVKYKSLADLRAKSKEMNG